MVVNEVALIKLRSGFDDLEFLELLMECQEIQDGWSREHHPHVLNNRPYSVLSTFCIQKTDPPYLLITAPWDSPEAHGEWIQSKENQSVFARLSAYIAPGCHSVLLFHMDSAGQQEELRGDLFAREKFSVCRISVSPDRRETAQKQYERIEGKVRQLGGSHRAWAGWRIENCDDMENMVVFWTCGVPDELLQRLLELSEIKREIRRFQHVV